MIMGLITLISLFFKSFFLLFFVGSVWEIKLAIHQLFTACIISYGIVMQQAALHRWKSYSSHYSAKCRAEGKVAALTTD